MKSTLISFIPILFILVDSSAFAQSNSNQLSEQQKLKEIHIIKAAFQQLHPGLYRYNSRTQMEKCFDLLAKQSIPATDQEYFLLLSQFTTKIRCGHTYLNPWNQEDVVKKSIFSKTVFPLLFQVIGRRIFVCYNLSTNKTIQAGDEVTAINGIAIKTIIDSLLTISRADGKNALTKKLNTINTLPTDIDKNGYALFDIYFPLFFPDNFDTETFTVKYRKPNNKSKETTVKSLTKTARYEAFISSYGLIPSGEQNWQFKFINPDIAYFKIGDFVTWSWKKDYKQYLDSIFSVLHHSSTNNLIIDVRGNEGGDDDTRNELLSYLIRKPFGCDNPEQKLYRYLSVPDSLVQYLQTWNDDFKKPKDSSAYLPVKEGLYKQKDSNCTSIQPKSTVFKGQVYVLIDAKNSSTTFTMADLLQTTQSATLIGERTGGTKQGLNGGQFFFLHLPYSHFEIDIPLIWQAPTTTRPDEGVIPDYKVLTTQADLLHTNDRQLKYTLSLIKTNTKKKL